MVRIIKRGIQTIIGTVGRSHKQFFVVPHDRRMAREVLISKEHLHEAKDGDKVVVKMTVRGSHRHTLSRHHRRRIVRHQRLCRIGPRQLYNPPPRLGQYRRPQIQVMRIRCYDMNGFLL